MSRRSAAEVERSLERHRRELELALADLRAGSREAADLGVHVARCRAQVADALDRNADELMLVAGGLGFVVAGGATGTVRVPFKLVGMALGRPVRRSTTEVIKMRQDRHSRQLGRALAAVAAADGQLRTRRVGFGTGVVTRTIRRAMVAAPAISAAVAIVLSEDDWRDALAKRGDELLDRLFAA